jgi:hypothetical protein
MGYNNLRLARNILFSPYAFLLAGEVRAVVCVARFLQLRLTCYAGKYIYKRRLDFVKWSHYQMFKKYDSLKNIKAVFCKLL